jgi:FkbM family methyltransferase
MSHGSSFLLVITSIFFTLTTHPISYPRPYHPYYSQVGQDKYVLETIFDNKSNGVFFDIGAHDGISFSNTYYMEAVLGWTGVCIEPQPDRFAQLHHNRTCICICGCIGVSAGQQPFLHIIGDANMLSGLASTYDKRHVQRIEDELRMGGGTYQFVTSTIYTFNHICKQHNITHIDFLSIDTEGGELQILESIDFDTVDITVIAIENNYGDSGLRTLLASKGYTLVAQLHMDEIYKKSFDTFCS